MERVRLQFRAEAACLCSSWTAPLVSQGACPKRADLALLRFYGKIGSTPQSRVCWSNLAVHNSLDQLRRTMQEFSD